MKKVKIVHWIVFVMFVLCLVVAPVSADDLEQPQLVSLLIYVIDAESRNVIPGADMTLEITGNAGIPPTEVTTDDFGQYRFVTSARNKVYITPHFPSCTPTWFYVVPNQNAPSPHTWTFIITANGCVLYLPTVRE